MVGGRWSHGRGEVVPGGRWSHGRREVLQSLQATD